MIIGTFHPFFCISVRKCIERYSMNHFVIYEKQVIRKRLKSVKERAIFAKKASDNITVFWKSPFQTFGRKMYILSPVVEWKPILRSCTFFVAKEKRLSIWL